MNLRFALRQIRRSPGFFAIAASLIAVGIAATSGIFALVDVLLLRPLPVRDPQTLVQLFEQQPKRPAGSFFNYRFYQQLASSSSTLSDFIGQIDTTRAIERSGVAERVHTAAVTESFFRGLGVQPFLGRVLVSGDRHVAVLSYLYWSRSFGRNAKVLGQTVRLQDHPYLIVGVTPEAFNGTSVDSSPDLWMPYADLPELSRTPSPNLTNYAIEIIARLRPGVSAIQAEQEAAAFWNKYMQQSSLTSADDYRGLKRGRLVVKSISRGLSPMRVKSGTALILLLAGTGLLLLMVCANIGGLLLSRAIAREKETSIRLALGASKAAILRQWLLESLLLTGMGGCVGLVLAYVSMPILISWLPPTPGLGLDPAELRASALHLSLDFRVAAFSITLCLFTALLCALAPAWRSSRPDMNIALKGTVGDRKTRVLQSALSALQIALCTTLLVSAGLIIRSLSNLRTSNPGFDGEHVIEFSIDPHVAGYDSQRTWLLQQRLLNGVRKLPGIAGAALANRGLMRGIGLGNSVVFPGQRGTGIVNTSVNTVTPEYFDVLKMHLLAGRNLGPLDIWEEGKLNRVVVNEAFVRIFLNGRNPIGETFGTGQQFIKPEYEIVGVVNDAKYRSMREIPPPTFYQHGFGPNAYPDAFILHVRSYGDPHAMIAPVRQLLQSIDPRLPPYRVATLEEQVDQSLWEERMLVILTSYFGAFALLLSAIGLYGTLANFVARRERDIGVRMALGATARQVIWLVGRRVVPILGVGVSGGLALAWLASTSIRSFLYGVQPVDLVSSLTASSLLIVIGVVGALVLSLRAIRVDPSTTLRQE